VYTESGQLLGEYDANGVPIYETIYLGAMPVGVLKQTGTKATANIATSIYNVYSDHLATPRVITRQSDEAIVWRWDSAEAFGATAPNQNPKSLGTFVFNQRLPGQVFDNETGLFQNWYRTYSSRMGRYIESDPIGLRGGINTYLYVSGNPLSYVDPMGLMDSVNARVLALVARGNLEEAILVAQAASGASAALLATRLQQLQAAIQTLTTRYPLVTNKCVDVAEGIADAARSASLVPQFIRIAPASPLRNVYIGDRYIAPQHFAVRFGDMVYDSFTGAQGMLYSQYVAMLNNSNLGPTSYVLETLKSLAPYK